MVSRCSDPGLLHYSSHHRAVTDAVLPSVNSTGLCRHEGPGVRGLLRIHVAQSASLVGTCHGFARLHAYGQGVLSQGLQNTARTELDHWRLSAAGYAAVELHGLSAALGSAVVLGHHGRSEHHFFDSLRGLPPTLLPASWPHRKCERVTAVLRVTHDDASAPGDRAHRSASLAAA